MKSDQLSFRPGFRLSVGNARSQAAVMVLPAGRKEGDPDTIIEARISGYSSWRACASCPTQCCVKPSTGGVWSIARGLARNVDAYKAHLAACDLPRRNDLDGRGNLSEETLAEFTSFFLQTCIDQVKFMEGLMQPDQLRNRILLWTEEEIRGDNLPPKSGSVLEAILYRGSLPRGDVADLLGTGERNARRVVAALTDRGDQVREHARTAVPCLPSHTRRALDAGLFPEQ